jgi:hypothetical protein
VFLLRNTTDETYQRAIIEVDSNIVGRLTILAAPDRPQLQVVRELLVAVTPAHVAFKGPPQTTEQLTELADTLPSKIDSHTPLWTYTHQIESYHLRTSELLAQSNLDEAYIIVWRAISLIVDKLPFHDDYERFTEVQLDGLARVCHSFR